MKIMGFGTHIKVSDIARSRAFYESLGLKPAFAMGTEEYRSTLPEEVESVPERYNGIVYQISDTATLEIADGHCGVKNQGVFDENIHSEKVSAMIKVDSLVDLFQNEQLTISFPVRQYYWGTIEVALRDPDGYVLVFIAQYSEQELAAVKKFVEVEEVQP